MKSADYGRRVDAVYQILFPRKTSAQGSVEWFRRRLLALHGYEPPSNKTVWRWLRGERHMPSYASVELLVVEIEARAALHKLEDGIG